VHPAYRTADEEKPATAAGPARDVARAPQSLRLAPEIAQKSRAFQAREPKNGD
jgi:hypothetical protein